MAAASPVAGSVPMAQTPEAAPAIADPAPLGLVAFGTTTVMLSFINAGVVAAAATTAVLPMAAAFGGLCQLLAGMWEFKRNNAFGATAFTSYGAFWFSYYLLVGVWAKTVPAADAGPVIGMYLFIWGVFTLYMFVASLAGVRAVQVVFFLLFVTFFLLAFGAWNWFGAGTGFTKIGGVVGILTGIAAMYTSFALVTNAGFKRTVLPVN